HDYLRENYCPGGQIRNNSLELIAYEAGHSMSSLCWNLLVQIVPLESGITSDPGGEITQAWNAVFSDQAVMQVQHQISALSTAMDDAYYQEHDQNPQTKTDVPTMANPDLPSQSIQAIKNSLDYWLAAVKWMSDPEKHKKIQNYDTDKLGWRKV